MENVQIQNKEKHPGGIHEKDKTQKLKENKLQTTEEKMIWTTENTRLWTQNSEIRIEIK